MRKILITLILGLVFLPLTARAQKWAEPYAEKDGTQVEGHWETPQDTWQKSFSRPGTVNPMTGQFNRYGNRNYNVPPIPETPPASSYDSPGSSPDRSAPNPYAVPGSSPSPNAPNPYAIPGSSPAKQRTSGSGR